MQKEAAAGEEKAGVPQSGACWKEESYCRRRHSILREAEEETQVKVLNRSKLSFQRGEDSKMKGVEPF